MADLSKRKRDALGRVMPRTGDEVIPSAKMCVRCGESKTLKDYSPDHRRIDGRRSRCKPCASQTEAERRLQHLEKARAYELSEARKTCRNARLRRRRQTDREYARRLDERNEIRRQLRMSGITTDTLYERDGGICHICGLSTTREEAEPDHVYPVARGGANTPDNVKLSHRSCNRRKRDLLDWSHLRPA